MNPNNNDNTIHVEYHAWCAKNSLPELVELKDPLNLALWKVTYATFRVPGRRIARIALNIKQCGANRAFLSMEKSLQLQLNRQMTATMIKRYQSAQDTSLAFHCPEPSPTVSIVIEPEFVRKCNESQHNLSVTLDLDSGETVKTDITMQIYSKHSGTRSKLLLNPKEKKPSSPRKNRGTKKSPKKNVKATRTVSVSNPAQKRRFLNAKRTVSVSDESDSEYDDTSSDEEFAIQPVKATQTRVLRGRRGASAVKKNNSTARSAKVLRDVDEDEKSEESSSDESLPCSNQVNSPQTREDEEIADTNNTSFPNQYDAARDEREYFGSGSDAVLMDLTEIYYGLHESQLCV